MGSEAGGGARSGASRARARERAAGDPMGFGEAGLVDVDTSPERGDAQLGAEGQRGGRTNRQTSAGSIDAGGGRTDAPMVNPVIINQAPPPAPEATPAPVTQPDQDGAEITGPQGAGRRPQRSLLTLGLAETARKTLLGI